MLDEGKGRGVSGTPQKVTENTLDRRSIKRSGKIIKYLLECGGGKEECS